MEAINLEGRRFGIDSIRVSKAMDHIEKTKTEQEKSFGGCVPGGWKGMSGRCGHCGRDSLMSDEILGTVVCLTCGSLIAECK